MKQTVQDLCGFSEQLFKRQQPLLPLWQTLSEHFYPERADFTNIRNVGTELADSLVDSYPILVRRDLANSFAAMLRDGDWFNMSLDGEPDHMGRMWLQWATKRMRKLFYHINANFVRSTKEGDHDYATFGQCVISVERNRTADGLLFRNWHLRDCAWMDDVNGRVGPLSRKWAPTYRDMTTYFKGNVHPLVSADVFKHPFKEGDVRHIVMPSEMYGDDQLSSRFPFVSLFVDVAHQHLLEETGLYHQHYAVPRFQTIAGAPYAYSPATVAGLPDARTLQAMTFTLLEAAERYARPPIIATQNVIRGDVNLNADGVTWVDKEYDEKLGASLRPLQTDKGGFPIGTSMREALLGTLSSAFYLNKLSLPETSKEMTAYEVQERMKQFRRENLPLFAPIESEYNGQLCEVAFDVAIRAGLLGSPYDIPESLRGQDISFKFESPLSQSDEEKKANQFNQTAQLLASVVQFDPNIIQNLNFDVAVRDAIMGIGSPATWLRSTEEVMQTRQAAAVKDAMDHAAQLAQAMPQGQGQPSAAQLQGVA